MVVTNHRLEDENERRRLKLKTMRSPEETMAFYESEVQRLWHIIMFLESEINGWKAKAGELDG
jgi:hypothetical protein